MLGIVERSNMAIAIEKIAVTPSEAATMLGVHVSTIYKLHGRGELPMRKVGRCSKIPIASVRALVEGEEA
jgi:excisionase family DNA binding protein